MIPKAVATMRPLVAPYIETLKPYTPGKPIEETEREYGITGVVKLASNENPLGPSPLAIEAMIRTFTTPEDEALLCKGSFLMYKVALQSHGRHFVEVPMQAGYRYDLA